MRSRKASNSDRPRTPARFAPLLLVPLLAGAAATAPAQTAPLGVLAQNAPADDTAQTAPVGDMTQNGPADDSRAEDSRQSAPADDLVQTVGEGDPAQAAADVDRAQAAAGPDPTPAADGPSQTAPGEDDETPVAADSALLPGAGAGTAIGRAPDVADLLGTAPPIPDRAAALESAGGNLAELGTKFHDLLDDGRVDAAAAVAERRVAELENAVGGDDPALIEPLTDLADVQRVRRDYAAAYPAYDRVVSLIERNDGVFSPDLVEPLTALGSMLQAQQRHEEAIVVLRRARHITHRDRGILNLDQLDIADMLAESYFSRGQLRDANREHRFAFRVSEHRFGAMSPDLVPALNELAEWYQRIDDHVTARKLYKKSLEILEGSYGPDDLSLVDPLHRIADSYTRGTVHMREGENALKRAIDLHERNPGSDPFEHTVSLVKLGDWYMVTSRRSRALETYRMAWELITSEGANPEQAERIFGRPVRLKFKTPDLDPTLLRREQNFVDVLFTVREDGMPVEIGVVESGAHWKVQQAVRVALSNARFRPRFEDGEPVTATMRYRYTPVIVGQPVPNTPVTNNATAQ